jgi:hypothetical protein
MFKWMQFHLVKGCCTDAMNSAVGNGQIEIVELLHVNRNEGCTHFAMDFAGSNRHLDVMKWIHYNRSEGCTEYAIDYAAEYGGHFTISKWLHFNRSEDAGMKFAARNSHYNIVEWLR